MQSQFREGLKNAATIGDYKIGCMTGHTDEK
jgi:hypothetical protein